MLDRIPSLLLIIALLATGLTLIVYGVEDRSRGIEITQRRYVVYVAVVAVWVGFQLHGRL
jgi:hypothetical protein